MSGPQPLVRIDGVSKRFGSFAAVNDVSLDVVKGEMFALLGGSGCGKTTLLRMLAGFETPDTGTIFIDGEDMARIPAYARPVNMMFQSYALFPHMTVEANVGYGLKYGNLSPAARGERVRHMLDLVQLGNLGARKPHQLSGGQRQRVALARALAKQPKLLLLDEPLAALDKQLREQTRFEIMNIQDRTGITFVLVTHDQEEAMTMADRIAVMDKGAIRQAGPPAEVYEHPNCRLVAGFIGSINMFDGWVTETAGRLSVHVPALGADIALEDTRREPGRHEPGQNEPGQKVTLAVRPEKIMLRRSDQGQPHSFRGRVKDLGYFGKDSLYRVALPSGALVSVSVVNSARGAAEGGMACGVACSDDVWMSFDPSAAILLTA